MYVSLEGKSAVVTAVRPDRISSSSNGSLLPERMSLVDRKETSALVVQIGALFHTACAACSGLKSEAGADTRAADTASR